MSPRVGDGSMYTCLFLPYLHFDSYKNLIRRRELILQRLCQGRAHPVPDSVAKSDSLEMQVIWEFLSHDPPLNCRRTLDQYGYPSLRDTRSRDDDQMLYKLTKDRMYLPGQQRDLYSQWSTSQAGWDRDGSGTWKESVFEPTNDNDDDEKRSVEDNVLNGNVLMVDQMWLWTLDSRMFTEAFGILECGTNIEVYQIRCYHSSRNERAILLKVHYISRRTSVIASSMKSTLT
jgi:hypothetical protein